MKTTGSLSVLNVGAGDIELRFNQHNTEEREKALKMLTDMQRRGYAILVRLDDGSYVRATEIDAERGCYVVQMPEMSTGLDEGPSLPGRRGSRKGPRGRQRRHVPIERAHAVGVARSAGG